MNTADQIRNVVIIEPEDTGRHFQPYGFGVSTPNIQQLAEEGGLFRNAYCESPMCSPSRAAMLTGETSHESGMTGIAHIGHELRHPERHLANWLAGHGYETALCGQQHEAAKGDRMRKAKEVLGYTTLPDDPCPDDERTAQIPHGRTRRDFSSARAAASYIREDHDSPYFLSLGLWNTHRGFPDLDEHEVDPNYVRVPSHIPDTPEMRRQMAGFCALVQYADECVGMVMDALRESGDIDETLVIFTIDHGIHFPRMKSTLYDDGIGIALIMRFPEGYRRGESIDSLVSHLDLYPTLCDYLGLESPEWLEGHSLMPLFRGECEKVRDEIFAEQNFAAIYDPKRCVRTERYKYIRLYDSYEWGPEKQIEVKPTMDLPAPGAIHEEIGAQRLPNERGLHITRPGDELLFDLYFDPEERINVAGEEKYEEIRQELSDRLDRWMERTDDPLLKGPVPRPPGSQKARAYR